MATQTAELVAGPELDALVAQQVMGLPVRTLHDPCPRCGFETRFCGTRAWCSCGWVYSPYKDYSTDIAAAREMEDELDRKNSGETHGLLSRYIQALAAEVGASWPFWYSDAVLFLRATPEQRCRAALAAVTSPPR